MALRVGIDTETTLISDDEPVPRLVCLAVSGPDDMRFLFDAHQAVQVFNELLRTSLEIVGHNIAFDMAVMHRAGVSIASIFDAYENGRILDTMIMAQMDDIARGLFRQAPYDLAACSQRYLEKHVDKSDDTWRLRYGELIDVPIDQWPQEAREYALNDADVALELSNTIQEVPDVRRQCAYAWWLHLTSVRGIATDQDKVHKLLSSAADECGTLALRLVQQGFLEYHKGELVRKQAKIQKAISEALGDKAKKTPKGKIKVDSEACESAGLEEYARYSELLKLLSSDAKYLLKPIVRPRFGLAESGRSTCSNPNLQNVKK